FSTAGANGTYSTAGAISVNTIRSIQTGNSGGTLTDTLTLGGTLTFGDKGGVYVLDAVAGNKQCLVINPAGQHVTAGASAGAELIFGVNGTTSGNQLTVNSVIADNSGGAVIIGTSADSTLSGKIHLLGNPVLGNPITVVPGCRLSTLATSHNINLTGQITGTGTLELYQGAPSGNVVLANAAQNNNCTGG